MNISGKLNKIVPRPKVTANYAGTGLGALIGGLLLAPTAVGAAAGAFLGSAANPTKPLPLDAALAKFVADKGLQFGGFERIRWNCIRVVFGTGANFFYIDADVQSNRASFSSVEALEDALYDAATNRIEEQVQNLGLR
jgi:hypothetical protein